MSVDLKLVIRSYLHLHGAVPDLWEYFAVPPPTTNRRTLMHKLYSTRLFIVIAEDIDNYFTLIALTSQENDMFFETI